MGSILSLIQQSYPPKPRWGVDDIPDLSGKVVIVTGGNAGCGKETVKALLAHNAKVYMASRSEEKATAAIRESKEQTGKEAIFLQLDLADLLAVKKSAEEFLSKEKELHILFNNGGVMACPVDMLSTQGYDLQFGTNVIGHFLFTKLLLPALFAATESSGEKSRIVTTSSSASYFLSKLDYDLITDSEKRRRQAPFNLYNQSKFGNVIVARELARRYGDKIVSTSLNPGNLKTDLQRHLPSYQKFLVDLMLYPVPYGALTQLYAGTAPEAAEYNGKWLIPWARVGTANKAALDPEAGEKLWAWLEEQVAKY